LHQIRAIHHRRLLDFERYGLDVAFNNHAGSTKSFDYVREHNEAVNRLDFIPKRDPITSLREAIALCDV